MAWATGHLTPLGSLRKEAALRLRPGSSCWALGGPQSPAVTQGRTGAGIRSPLPKDTMLSNPETQRGPVGGRDATLPVALSDVSKRGIMVPK